MNTSQYAVKHPNNHQNTSSDEASKEKHSGNSECGHSQMPSVPLAGCKLCSRGADAQSASTRSPRARSAAPPRPPPLRKARSPEERLDPAEHGATVEEIHEVSWSSDAQSRKPVSIISNQNNPKCIECQTPLYTLYRLPSALLYPLSTAPSWKES